MYQLNGINKGVVLYHRCRGLTALFLYIDTMYINKYFLCSTACIKINSPFKANFHDNYRDFSGCFSLGNKMYHDTIKS